MKVFLNNSLERLNLQSQHLLINLEKQLFCNVEGYPGQMLFFLRAE